MERFSERIAELRRMTGAPHRLRGSVTVDQIYAHYQHEHLEFRHPRGGRALYLQAPFFDKYDEYLDAYAREVLDDGGQHAMERSMENLSEQVEREAPREFGDLMRSGHPEVFSGDNRVYDRPPQQHRLSEQELRMKARLRHLPPELIGYIWWHVMHKQEPPPHLRGRRRA
jgi:hypothetical protein